MFILKYSTMLSQSVPPFPCHIIIINNAVNQSWSCKASKYPVIHIIGVFDEHKEFVSWMTMHTTCNHIFRKEKRSIFHSQFSLTVHFARLASRNLSILNEDLSFWHKIQQENDYVGLITCLPQHPTGNKIWICLFDMPTQHIFALCQPVTCGLFNS